MGRWTYYSPVWLGALLVLALNEPVRAQLPLADARVQWLVVLGVALGFGWHCQVLMVGAQGAFAQVLPVPGGRSIRGRAALVAGWLLMTWYGLSLVTLLLAFEAVKTAAYVVGVVTLAALGGALVVYGWSLPAAVVDFREEGRRGTR